MIIYDKSIVNGKILMGIQQINLCSPLSEGIW